MCKRVIKIVFHSYFLSFSSFTTSRICPAYHASVTRRVAFCFTKHDHHPRIFTASNRVFISASSKHQDLSSPTFYFEAHLFLTAHLPLNGFIDRTIGYNSHQLKSATDGSHLLAWRFVAHRTLAVAKVRMVCCLSQAPWGRAG
jgi:hypothetical protein